MHGRSTSIFRVYFQANLSYRQFSVQTRRKKNVPAFACDKVKDMQLEIAAQFVSDVVPRSPNLAESDSQFTANLQLMAKYYFEQGGKMFRPTVALVMAKACNSSLECGSDDVSLNQYKIGMISEMIHTASLVHDDVIDGADTRRGSASVNAVWGNKMAVLVGDYILARATQVLCSIGRPNVISVMASIIEDLVLGEFMQMTAKADSSEDLLSNYMEKTFKKTASLFANTCKSAAILAEGNNELQLRAYEYGRHLGLAFQLIDDLLDFVSSAENMGKPVATDLKLGLSTAPVIYASYQYPELYTLMTRKFSMPGDPDLARKIVLSSNGLERTRALAEHHVQEAVRLAEMFPNVDGVADVLAEFAVSQLDRQS
ncbi:unnamed protein product [Auanema sp. JU1783]|nr:unnamed protein product [Auanema sp. JU1783]